MKRCLLFFVLAACRSEPQDSALRADRAAYGFGIDGVRTLLRQHPEATTGDAFLALLPDELRSQYTLLHTSRSLQEARPAAPRVLMYTDTLFVGFNGAPDARGYDRFELMEYDRDAKRFHLAEVRFAQDAPPVLTESPPICAICHGDETRPLWNPYPLWPGAYDTNDHMEYTITTARNLDAFLKAAPDLDRYRRLEDLHVYRRRAPSRELADRLRDASTEQMRERLVPQSRNFRAFSYFVAASDRCNDRNLAGFIPPALNQAFAADWPSVEQETAERQDRLHNDETRRAREMAGYQTGVDAPYDSINFSAEGRRVTAALRFVLERDGASVGAWFPTIGGDSYRMPRDIFALSQILPSSLHPAGDCDELRAKSQEALRGDVADLLATGLPRRPVIAPDGLPRDELLRQTYRFVAETCAGCHAGTEGVPPLPFELPSELRAQLAQGPLKGEILRRLALPAGAAGAMPPSAALDAEVRENFASALEALER